jgi:peptide deformylase
MVLINPEVEFLNKETKILEEGCLSFPGYYDKVVRRQKVKVNFIDISGKEQKIVAEDLLSRVIQHEVDHLKGIVFVQRMPLLNKAKFLAQYILKNKKFE